MFTRIDLYYVLIYYFFKYIIPIYLFRSSCTFANRTKYTRTRARTHTTHTFCVLPYLWFHPTINGDKNLAILDFLSLYNTLHLNYCDVHINRSWRINTVSNALRSVIHTYIRILHRRTDCKAALMRILILTFPFLSPRVSPFVGR